MYLWRDSLEDFNIQSFNDEVERNFEFSIDTYFDEYLGISVEINYRILFNVHRNKYMKKLQNNFDLEQF